MYNVQYREVLQTFIKDLIVDRPDISQTVIDVGLAMVRVNSFQPSVRLWCENSYETCI